MKPSITSLIPCSPDHSARERRRGKAAGFGLLQFIVVLAILAMIAAAVLPVYRKVSTRAQIRTAGTLPKNIAGVVQSFAETNGPLPITCWPSELPVFVRKPDGNLALCRLVVTARTGTQYTINYVDQFTNNVEATLKFPIPLASSVSMAGATSTTDTLFTNAGRAEFDLWTAIRDSLQAQSDALTSGFQRLEAGSLFSINWNDPEANQTIGVRWNTVEKAFQPYDTTTGVPLGTIGDADVPNYRPIVHRAALVSVRIPVFATEGGGQTAVFLVSGPVPPDVYAQLDEMIDQSTSDRRDNADTTAYNQYEARLGMVDTPASTTYNDFRGNCMCSITYNKNTDTWSGNVFVFVGYF